MTKNLIIEDLTNTVEALEFEIESLKDTIEDLKEEIGNLKDSCTELQNEKLSILAETDNYKKRIKRENESQKEFMLESFIINLLPFLDSLETGLTYIKDRDLTYDGFKLALTSYITSLEKFGLEPFNSVGEEFNPSYHDAISVQECPNIEKNIIITEILKGYRLNKRVIRAAKVVVSA